MIKANHIILVTLLLSLFIITTLASPTYVIPNSSQANEALQQCRQVQQVQITGVLTYEDSIVFTSNISTDDGFKNLCGYIFSAVNIKLSPILYSPCFIEVSTTTPDPNGGEDITQSSIQPQPGVMEYCPGALGDTCDNTNLRYCGNNLTCKSSRCLYVIPKQLPIVSAKLQFNVDFDHVQDFMRQMQINLGPCAFDFVIPTDSRVQKYDVFMVNSLNNDACSPALILESINLMTEGWIRNKNHNLTLKITQKPSYFTNEQVGDCFNQETGEIGCKNLNPKCPITCYNSQLCERNSDCGSSRCALGLDGSKRCAGNDGMISQLHLALVLLTFIITMFIF